MNHPIEKLTIEGFKSIKKLEDFPLKKINIMIGANGSGKTNFVAFFRLVLNMIQRRLQYFVLKNGGPEAHLYMGSKETDRIVGMVHLGRYGYEFKLRPTTDNRLIISDERFSTTKPSNKDTSHNFFASGDEESQIIRAYREGPQKDIATHIYLSIMSWGVYHFHDTGDTAKVKRSCAINQNERLYEDGGNLAAFLYPLYQQDDISYRKIRDVVRLVAPFFENFKLRPIVLDPDKIQLEWTQNNSDYPFLASQLSDGTLRFICLATALLQPNLPSTILIDEPELGLHPYALTLLASLIKQAAERSQVIVATQSVSLLDHFNPADVVVIDHSGDESIFKRLDEKNLDEWLEDYTLGELWQKNVIGGRP